MEWKEKEEETLMEFNLLDFETWRSNHATWNLAPR